MTCSTSGSCNVLSDKIDLFITFANPSLSDSFWPRITVHLNSFSVSRLAWVSRLRSGSSLPLKRSLTLCVLTKQAKDQVHRELDVNSDCRPISTWEVQNKLSLQRDAVDDICTNRTFQLQPQRTRNNVCISRVCRTGTVSTCTFPIFARFSTRETFLAFALSLPLGRFGVLFACLPFPELFPLILPFDVCGCVLPFSWPDFFPLSGPFPFQGFDPLPDAVHART